MTAHGGEDSKAQRERELEVLAESSRLLSSTLDLGEVLERLADITRSRLELDVVRIWLLDEGGQALRLRAHRGVTHLELATRIATSAEAGRTVVTIADTGTGMSAETLRRAFEPFFTTKGVKRTGLGLAVAYGAVRRHGGQIALESAPGLGTTVSFWLPGAESDEAPVLAVPPEPERMGSILVIDDEADVRELLTEVLTGRGHTVTVAAGGREGLARFEAGRFDLVLTDLGMPDFNGWEVARVVKAARSDTPVLLLTGWADPVDPSEEGRVDGIVRKPFDLNRLAAVINSALAPRA